MSVSSMLTQIISKFFCTINVIVRHHIWIQLTFCIRIQVFLILFLLSGIGCHQLQPSILLSHFIEIIHTTQVKKSIDHFRMCLKAILADWLMSIKLVRLVYIFLRNGSLIHFSLARYFLLSNSLSTFRRKFCGHSQVKQAVLYRV